MEIVDLIREHRSARHLYRAGRFRRHRPGCPAGNGTEVRQLTMLMSADGVPEGADDSLPGGAGVECEHNFGGAG